jgi:hypothetical protein
MRAIIITASSKELDKAAYVWFLDPQLKIFW